jgi:hypothetical protein
MECNKLGLEKRLLKVRAKVTGFLVAKIEKRNTPEQVIVTIKNKKNTITGLQYLLNAFQTYMSGVTYTGPTAASSGIIITTSSGQQITLSFVNTPGVSVTSDSAIVSFSVQDDSNSSYTATSEELVTRSAGYNIPIATANLSVTKNSDEILTMTWVITVSISSSGGITYVPTTTPQSGGASGCALLSGKCSICVTSSANSEYPNTTSGCSLYGLASQYPNSSYVTTQLFTDIFYNTYGTGPSNSFTYASSTTLVIYTQYCNTYFFAGAGNGSASGVGSFGVFDPGNTGVCATFGSGYPLVVSPIYVQIYSPTETSSYVGVQIEFTT